MLPAALPRWRARRHKKQTPSVTRRRKPATSREFFSLPGLLAAMYLSLL